MNMSLKNVDYDIFILSSRDMADLGKNGTEKVGGGAIVLDGIRIMEYV
jgi:hypothetical protein